MDTFSFFNFILGLISGRRPSSMQKGFSLIELLVVFSIVGMTMVTSIATFYNYNKNQGFVSSVANLKQELNLARSRAMSGVKPSYCSGMVLKYYQIYIVAPGSTYRINVMCDNTLTTIQSFTLANGVTFTAASPISINFKISTGIIDSPKTITISGNGSTQTITVDSTGSISVQ